jgi:hypothetical protein
MVRLRFGMEGHNPELGLCSPTERQRPRSASSRGTTRSSAAAVAGR